MKKSFLVFLTFTTLVISSVPAIAAVSEFGDSFSGSAPMALGGNGYGGFAAIDDNMAVPDMFLNLEPAAGAEKIDEKPVAQKRTRYSGNRPAYRAPRHETDNQFFVRKRSGE